MGKSKPRNKNGLPNRKPKLNIAFDPKERVEYLSGFHKRKLERKALYKTKLEKQVVAEKLRINAQVRKSSGKVSSSHSILPEVKALLGLSEKNLEPTLIDSFVLGSKLVTVSSLDDIHMKPSDIDNPEDSEEEKKGEGEDDHEPIDMVQSQHINVKKTANRMLQHSKAFKACQRLKQKKKSRGRNKKNKSNFAQKNQAAADKPAPNVQPGQPIRRKGKTRANKKNSGKQR